MKLRILGCSGAEFPGHNTSAFLVDDCLLMDAGTVGAVLEEEEQLALSHIFVTHTHIDHIKGIPLLADNITMNRFDRNFKLVSTATILQAMRQHLLNNIIWPDFSNIPSEQSPVISYVEIESGREYLFNGYSVAAYPVNHSVPAVGYIIRKGEKSILYTGDTGPTSEIWKHADNLSAMIVEVSFPNELIELATLTKHLTPGMLAEELSKLKELPPRILITHLKPQFISVIKTELAKLDVSGLEVLEAGDVYYL